METRRFSYCILLACVLSYCAYAQAPQWMQMLGPDEGWLASPVALFWTTDNGRHWRNIAPTMQSDGVPSLGIISVFFLNRSKGWALLSDYDEALSDNDEPRRRFYLGSTTNSGATWSVKPIDLPVSPNCRPSGEARMQFTSERDGWINLTLESGSAFDFGDLLTTQDGGSTWKVVPGPGTSGELRFIDRQNGWVVSRDGDKLWMTHDNAKTWKQVSLSPPPEAVQAESVMYELPVFDGNGRGALEVSFMRAQGLGALVLFRSSDRGRTWKFSTVLGNDAHCCMPTGDRIAFADSALISVRWTADNVTLRKLLLADTKISTTTAEVGDNRNIWSLNFVTAQRGWLLTTLPSGSFLTAGFTQLYSTTDGGATWAEVTPRVVKPHHD